MEAQVSIFLDTRRAKKNDLYPVKLRIYLAAKTVFYPTIYDISKSDFEKLKSKRASERSSEIRKNLLDIELNALKTVRNIHPFSFNKFYSSYIHNNKFFKTKLKHRNIFLVQEDQEDEICKQWEKKFPILKERHPSQFHISFLYSKMIKRLLLQARIGTSSNYLLSYNSIKTFKGNVEYSLITPQFLKEYEGWMITLKGKSKTTVGIYIRVLRAVINEAIEEKLMGRDDYPFGRRRYLIPSGRNIKKALDKKTIAKIYYADSLTKSQEKARDFWFFSFYGNGMNVKDIISVKLKNIQNEFLVFERAKTELTARRDQPIVISCFINEDMKRIIDKWGNDNKDPENYIFPILQSGLSPTQQYYIRHDFVKFINQNMAKICNKIELGKKIRTMEARHSASTLMKNAGVSPHFIKESLGHTSLKTTENYLAGFENEQRKEFSKVLDGFKKDI